MQLYEKLLIVGGVITGSTLMFMFVAFNPILKVAVSDQSSLKKGNQIRDVYLKIPFPLDFSVYFFNVTNPMEIQKGAKPILEEVGPYTYDEYVEKVDVIDNEAEDSLSYLPFHTFYFNQEKSGELSDEDVVTILNPLIVGMVNLVARDSPALLSVVNQSIAPLFRNPQSIYLTGRVKDILFEGIEIDCTATEFAPKAVCAQLKSQIPGIQKLPDKNVFLFSLFGPRNATTGKKMKVTRGVKSYKETGTVLEYDGKKELNLWGTKECNTFKGTDGWIVPPLIDQEEGISIFSTDLCRNLHGYYTEDGSIKGIFVNKYEADFGDMSSNPDEKCYCSSPEKCLKKGVFDVSKCMRVPIYVTLPHFYKTDEIYLSQVDGLSPDPEKHKVELQLEHITSAPVHAAKRVQLNFLISPTPKVTLMTSVPEALHPMFWLEESVNLEGPILKKIQFVSIGLKIVGILKWISLVVGSAILGIGGYLYLQARHNSKVLEINKEVNDIMSIKSSKLSDSGEVNSAFESDNERHRETKKNVMTGHEFDRFK